MKKEYLSPRIIAVVLHESLMEDFVSNAGSTNDTSPNEAKGYAFDDDDDME